MDFIDAILESTKEYEAPRRFYQWAAYTAISAVLKDRVWFDMAGNYNLYPNIYVLLYAQSSARKGPPISLAERIIKKVDNTRVINGRSSIEAVIKELGTIQTRPGKKPINDSCGLMIASELSSSIISNPSAMDIMTQFYDRIYNEGEWKYKLKVGESVTLKRPTITWFTGTNEALFKEFIPEKNINGGLIGRTFIISESKRNKVNSLMWRPKMVPNIDDLAKALIPITQLEGEFVMEEPIRQAYDIWYNEFVTKLEPEIKDDTGFVGRIGDFVIKMSMIISSGRRGDKKLLIEDVKEAMDVVLPLIVPTKKVSASIKKGDISAIEKRGLVVRYISNQPEFKDTRKRILKNLSLKIDGEDLDKVIQLLAEADVVKAIHAGGEVTYALNMEKEEVRKWIETYRT